MKAIKNILIGIMLVLTTFATQGCDDIKENWRQSWATRYLPGVWIMTDQKYIYYDEVGQVKETHSNSYSIYPGNNRDQKQLIVDREDGDEFFFSISFAHKGNWEPEASYHVIIDENGDMFRSVGSIAGGNQEEYLGTIEKLKMFKMEMFYDGPDYSVETVYTKVTTD